MAEFGMLRPRCLLFVRLPTMQYTHSLTCVLLAITVVYHLVGKPSWSKVTVNGKHQNLKWKFPWMCMRVPYLQGHFQGANTNRKACN